MDIHWAYRGQTYNVHTMDTYWTYNGHAMDIQWTYNRHLLGMSWHITDRHIVDI